MGACDFSVSRDAAARRRSAGRGESSREAPSFADNFSAADAHVKDSAKRGAQTHRESARGDGIIGIRFAGASARRRRTRGLSGSRRRQGEPPTSPGAPAAGGQLPHNASEAFSSGETRRPERRLSQSAAPYPPRFTTASRTSPPFSRPFQTGRVLSPLPTRPTARRFETSFREWRFSRSEKRPAFFVRSA